jgi:inward rectifier potassium channel
MIRAANLRQNIVQDASAHLYMLRDEVTQEGFRIRRVIDLPLMRSQHPMFVLGWTMMHAIDESSPLNGETAESLTEADPTFVLSMSGSDQSTGQTLTARAAYSHRDIRWGATFRDVLEEAPDGSLHLDYTKFDEVDPL